MQTAKEFIKTDESGIYNEVDITKAMIEFAKMHVAEALKCASEEMRIKAISNDEGTYVIKDKQSVLNAYSLDGIV